MDTDLPSIKLIVIVLVVLAKGGSELMKWIKKKQEESRRNEGMLKIPGSQDSTATQDSSSEPGNSWDPFEEMDKPVAVPQPIVQPKSTPSFKVYQEAAPVPAAAPTQSVSEQPPSAIMHKVISAHSSRTSTNTKSIFSGNRSLRSMMLAKVILDRPVSTLGRSGRSQRA